MQIGKEKIAWTPKMQSYMLMAVMRMRQRSNRDPRASIHDVDPNAHDELFQALEILDHTWGASYEGAINRAAISLVGGWDRFMKQFRRIPQMKTCCSLDAQMKVIALGLIAAEHDPGYVSGAWQHPPHEEHDAAETLAEVSRETTMFLLGVRWQIRDDQQVYENNLVRNHAWHLTLQDEGLLPWYDVFFENRLHRQYEYGQGVMPVINQPEILQVH